VSHKQGTSRSILELPAKAQSRVQISRVEPEIEGGRYPIKRVIDDAVEVTADIVVDGHNALAGVVLY
jgi:starch synthase (maltosyl-transferring)